MGHNGRGSLNAFVDQAANLKVRGVLADLLSQEPERAFVAHDGIDADDLPPSVVDADGEGVSVDLRVAEANAGSRYVVNLVRILDVESEDSDAPFVRIEETATFGHIVAKNKYRRRVYLVDEDNDVVESDPSDAPEQEWFTQQERLEVDTDVLSDDALIEAVEAYDSGVPVEFALDLVQIVGYCMSLQRPRPDEAGS